MGTAASTARGLLPKKYGPALHPTGKFPGLSAQGGYAARQAPSPSEPTHFSLSNIPIKDHKTHNEKH
jgi:hypothetical protein